MMQGTAKIRLYVEQALSLSTQVSLPSDQAHYLLNVMRMSIGDTVLLFNGRDGEWQARIDHLAKRSGELSCECQTLPQRSLPDIWLLFSPVKKARTDFIVEKAAELGCAAIQPVFTAFTNAGRVNEERLEKHMIEAVEQCGGVAVPEMRKATDLKTLMQHWDPTRDLIFCDERRTPRPMIDALASARPKAAILVGPEGGFSPSEAQFLEELAYTIPVSLGPRILRADTAAVTALSLWQAHCGDWK